MSRIKDFRLPPAPCLGCGKVLDYAMSTKGTKPPRPGMVSVCMSCGHIQIFNSELKYRNLTDDEMKEIAGDPHLLRVMAVLASYKRAKAGKQ